MPTATVQYRAAPGAGFNDQRAKRYGAFLERKVGLGKRPASPEEIVDAARPKSSPIHDAFTWDDTAAAERWRLSEARHLVSHIVLSMPRDEGDTVEVRAFHNVVSETGDRGYLAERTVWKSPELAEQVVERAMSELHGWVRRYRVYSELAGVVAHVERALENGE